MRGREASIDRHIWHFLEIIDNGISQFRVMHTEILLETEDKEWQLQLKSPSAEGLIF